MWVQQSTRLMGPLALRSSKPRWSPPKGEGSHTSASRSLRPRQHSAPTIDADVGAAPATPPTLAIAACCSLLRAFARCLRPGICCFGCVGSAAADAHGSSGHSSMSSGLWFPTATCASISTINEGKGQLKSWMLCDGLSEGVMGQGLAAPPLPPAPCTPLVSRLDGITGRPGLGVRPLRPPMAPPRAPGAPCGYKRGAKAL